GASFFLSLPETPRIDRSRSCFLRPQCPELVPFHASEIFAGGHGGTRPGVLRSHDSCRPAELCHLAAARQAGRRTTWLGRRDHAFLITAVQTGLRLSEMTGLRHEDVSLGAGPHVHCRGKGRKERCTPLAKHTVAVLKAWIREQGREDSKTLFP